MYGGVTLSPRPLLLVASLVALSISVAIVPARAGESPRVDVPSGVAADDSPVPPSASPVRRGPAASDTTTATPQDLDLGDADEVLSPVEPDVVVINLPTGMRLPRHGSNFRLTHRFAGDLRRGTFGQNAANLFGLDQGAIIGFEFRMNVAPNLQVAGFRTNFDKTIQIHGLYELTRQTGRLPASISVVGSIEGTDNFQQRYAPAIGAIVSHRVATRLALYAVPMWVGHTNASLEPIGHDHDHGADPAEDAGPHEHPAHERENTVMLGLGARLRLTRTIYVVAEVAPRLDGYRPGEAEYGFGIEKRVGGHAFSLTFTNSFSTTYSQLARGGNPGSLYKGFNLGRKFY